jgi:hypothetical protein
LEILGSDNLETTVFLDVIVTDVSDEPVVSIFRSSQYSEGGKRDKRRSFFCPEVGGSRFLRNIRKSLPDCTASHLRRQQTSYSAPCEPYLSDYSFL